MTNPIVERIKNKDGLIVQGEHVSVLMPEKPATLGHLLVTPNDPYPILEAVPDFIVKDMFAVANKLSVVLFDSLGAGGSNMFVQNGVEAGQTVNQVLLHVVARSENDGIQLEWSPKEISNDEMGSIELKIKEHAGGVGSFLTEEQAAEQPALPERDTSQDYLIHALKRLP